MLLGHVQRFLCRHDESRRNRPLRCRGPRRQRREGAIGAEVANDQILLLCASIALRTRLIRMKHPPTGGRIRTRIQSERPVQSSRRMLAHIDLRGRRVSGLDHSVCRVPQSIFPINHEHVADARGVLPVHEPVATIAVLNESKERQRVLPRVAPSALTEVEPGQLIGSARLRSS